MNSLREIIHETSEHQEMIALRNRILREPFGIRFTEEELLREQQDFLIGYYSADNTIIGCCVLSPLESGTAQLRQMAVEEAYQKEGIGAKILSFAEQFTREKGFDKILLHARKWAVGFYEKAGYTVVGEEFIEVGMPHYNMEKILL